MSDDTKPGSKRSEKEQDWEERDHEQEQRDIEKSEAAKRPGEEMGDREPDDE